jgi:hypothetical protein
MVLLNTLIASSSASLSDTTSLTSAYSRYLIVFENLIPSATSAQMQMLLQVGGVFQTSGYQAVNQSVNNGSGGGRDNETAFIPLSNSATTAVPNSGFGYCGEANIITPSNASIQKAVYGTGTQYQSGAGVYTGTFAGSFVTTTAAVTGFEVLFSTGNIASGVIKIYGA